MLPCLFFLNIDGGVQMASRAPANLSAPTKAPDGLTWEEVSNTSVQAGIAVHNVGLEAALPLRLQFKKEELDTWKVPHLRHDSYVRVGDKWYRPAAAHSVLSQVHGNTSFPSRPQKEGGNKGGGAWAARGGRDPSAAHGPGAAQCNVANSREQDARM
jgi:hypothetical protein